MEGGSLVHKNIGGLDKVLIAKTLWKIHMNKYSLWVKWVSHSHSHFGYIWDWRWQKDESPLVT